MRFYIISDRMEFGVSLANMLNGSGHSAILSESQYDNTKGLVGALKEQLPDDTIVILICQNAKEVGISANRLSGMRAVTCKDEEDAREAMRDTDANVLLLETSKVSKKMLSDVTDGILSGLSDQRAGQHVQSEEEWKQMEPRQKQQGQQFPQGPKKSMFIGLKEALTGRDEQGNPEPEEEPAHRSKPKPTPRQQQQSAPAQRSQKRKKGLMEGLKESLGFEGEEE